MSIFTHIVLGTNDLAKSRKFYDAALGALGVKYIGPMGENGAKYGKERPEFFITKPADGKPATHANGGTLGFIAKNRKAVDAFHDAAMKNGGSDEGKPGLRSFAPTAYAAYARDPDGNKICSFTLSEE